MKILIPIFALVASAAAGAQDLAITGATVYESPTAAPMAGTTVVIRNGVISGVGQHPAVPRSAKVISCPHCVVVAGFWNSHVHFMEPKWNDAAHQPAETLSLQMSDMLTHSGFTTVVDTASDTDNTVTLRQLEEAGKIVGPRIFTAGFPIFPAHALPYYLAALPPDLAAKMGQPETPAQAASFVEKNRAAGGDIVKLFTGSILHPGEVVPMRLDVARAAVDEAHRNGQLVFAHSTNLAGTEVAIEAGVDVLAHTPEVTDGIDEAMLRRMLARHMTIISTLKLFSQDVGSIGKIRDLLHRYHAMGGRVVYGTDTGFLPDYDQGEEFRQLALAGFGFRDVLAMLTTGPADLFHLSDSEGKVMPGMKGDLTILSEDPSSGNPEAFTKVQYTIRDGKVIWRGN